jgi:hypothetical protein
LQRQIPEEYSFPVHFRRKYGTAAGNLYKRGRGENALFHQNPVFNGANRRYNRAQRRFADSSDVVSIAGEFCVHF